MSSSSDKRSLSTDKRSLSSSSGRSEELSGGKHFAYGQSLGGRRGSSATHVKNPFSTMIKIPSKMGKKVVGLIMRVPKSKKMEGVVTSGGLGEASIHHALVVIFLEFFAWGLLTSPMITVLNETFPDHTFLMNGLIMGIKGLLSFLSAPLIGALSDIWGRKFFLLITVFFTCAPIPLMKINNWWYFAMISISGIFAVTFSVVFAYVADVTDESERSAAYGLVSATFAASLVTSPALGAWIEANYGEELVVAAATAIAILDVFFIMVAVPESLPEKCKPTSRGLTLEQVDPFSSLRKMWKDSTVLMLCITVFLSYLPEAGQYSCFFVYLRLVMNFSKENVAMFIAAIGILSVIAQTGLLTLLMKTVGPKHTIMIGLFFEMLQLMWYGFGSQQWMMWSAGILASISSISYPAISAFVSMHADSDKQGAVQGMITGIRGLCNGLGPAMFGLIFYLFHVDLNEKGHETATSVNETSEHHTFDMISALMPGPPFVFGAFLVILAILVAAFIPDTSSNIFSIDEDKKNRRPKDDERGRKRTGRDEVIKLSDDSVTTDSEDDYNVPLIKEGDLL
ncbi:hippocampus abundant transcript 1 protein [Eurytemora carolleeae]|uniref:hippocampus abundant transcript 1 protein n=1 Tax=Eurytemora carolleeae TaxID=1294199 RepID=UPI000C78393E|nr:hippocampus abundant transcript 1 protein [Eurytemora carolleeae]|eukprot:XP_023325863.1 hippocampus abundant transcript 1 protein-like [Eurytemora affinis]